MLPLVGHRRSRGRPKRERLDEFRCAIVRAALDGLVEQTDLIPVARDVRAGKHLTRDREVRLAAAYPPVGEIIRWPLGLLRNCAIAMREIDALAAHYAIEVPSISDLTLDPAEQERSTRRMASRPHPIQNAATFNNWDRIRYDFPADESGQCLFHPMCLDALVRRGDIYGYLGCLISYRVSEKLQCAHDQWMAARALVRTLPGACLHPFVISQAKELIALTATAISQLPIGMVPVTIDAEAVEKLIRFGTAYEEGGDVDPLVHFRLSPCPVRQATIVLSSGCLV